MLKEIRKKNTFKAFQVDQVFHKDDGQLFKRKKTSESDNNHLSGLEPVVVTSIVQWKRLDNKIQTEGDSQSSYSSDHQYQFVLKEQKIDDEQHKRFAAAQKL